MRKLAILLFLINTISVKSQTVIDPAAGTKSEVNQAIETINCFKSFITINKNNSLSVKEEIKILVTGETIKHGIFREFPTTYSAAAGSSFLGHSFKTGFDVTKVLLDGKPEKYVIENIENGKVVKIGSADKFVKPGLHTYTIIYNTDKQMGFFETHDELYWNVTGNNWQFPIDTVIAEVRFPAGIKSSSIQTTAFTGYSGSKGTNFESLIKTNLITFKTKQPLKTGEGLTIVAQFPRGVIVPRSEMEMYFLRLGVPQSFFLAYLGMLLSVCFIYFIVWYFYGKDPSTKLVMPEFRAPENLSPAAIRFINKQGYDAKCLAVTLINGAVKGFYNIVKQKYGLTLERGTKDLNVLNVDEQAVLQRVVDRDRLELKSSYSETMYTLNTKQQEVLESKFGNLFKTNSKLFWLCSFASLVVAVLFFNFYILLAVFVSFIAIAFLSPVIMAIVKFFKAVFTFDYKKFELKHLIPVGILLFIIFQGMPIVTFIAGIIGYNILNPTVLLPAVVILTLVIISFIFYRIFSKYTTEGTEIMAKINGLKMFLSATEKDRVKMIGAPGETPDLYEKLLPYAMALDVEKAWSNHFTSILASSQYNPQWAQGMDIASTKGFGVGSGLSSFTSEIASGVSTATSASSSAPGRSSGGSSYSSGGSSSGGGSRGSSGGGGGGGGGGGW